ncbi:DUF4190 domain-containing protein [Aquihabitans daechungensis]|uniref:DUF4190 domain-containing protein n=1 Tax=Aquihabitans daechungensis TaxID=1052257 RepID=UPI003B9ED2A8
MSDVSQGPGWWQASDGRWYPPTAKPGTAASVPERAPMPGYRPPAVPPTGPPSPYGPPPGYGYGYGYALNPNGTPSGLPSVAGLATASMVLGILSAVICCYPLMLCSLAGLPLGLVALIRIQKGTADPKGKGQAIAGVALSSIVLALGIIGIVLIVLSERTA